MIKVSAPGKLLLIGDHAVVYDRPCLVTAVNHRMSVSMEKRDDNVIVINAPEVAVKDFKIDLDQVSEDQPKAVRFVIRSVKNFFEKYNVKSGLNISTKSEFSSKFGFGSSSAVTVCTVKALSEVFGIEMTKKEIFDMSYKTVMDIQKVGSGFDVAAAVYGGVLYFFTAGKIIESLNAKQLPLVVGYTGIKADTSTIVKRVKADLEQNPEIINNIFDEITKITESSKDLLANSDWSALGQKLTENQKLLSELGVSSQELDNLISKAVEAGAYGAKLSGAGGGDCMIALAEDNRGVVEKAITEAGGTIIPVETNAEGVRVE